VRSGPSLAEQHFPYVFSMRPPPRPGSTAAWCRQGRGIATGVRAARLARRCCGFGSGDSEDGGILDRVVCAVAKRRARRSPAGHLRRAQPDSSRLSRRAIGSACKDAGERSGARNPLERTEQRSFKRRTDVGFGVFPNPKPCSDWPARPVEAHDEWQTTDRPTSPKPPCPTHHTRPAGTVATPELMTA